MIGEALRRLVRSRAQGRCEYCRLAQIQQQNIRFHIEHIIPQHHGGHDLESNLALACSHCNLRKGSNLAGIDPESGSIAPLFDPRKQEWNEHFEFRGAVIVGKSASGRATIQVLRMNDQPRLELRARINVE